ncbi:calcineurin-like phosphoesterase family protein [Albibacterium bauzanense]|uniref:Calcineurin-like phosphoesterase family protein n=1 Tax=Albibacterium bauzanense TaxID=653929 RepID=A0A4R1M0I4_9SPHI|nr:calcineurin-like phosphoesterase family protein [Albibacterium bauzanense]
MKASYLLLFFCISIFSCKNLEYSPSQILDKDSYKNINASNLERLGDGSQDDTVRFIVTGDTQRSYDETIKFYRKVNSIPEVDFVIVAGDVTEFGTLKEMQWLARELNNLTVPYVTVIGNHDLTMRGRDVFKRMYGELNYSFNYGGVKFICHDTNSREYQFSGNVPNIPWLRKQLQPEVGISNYVAISHVPPISDDFDEKLVKDYAAAFDETPGFLISFHGHTHNFEEFKLDNSNIPYVITSAMGKREFLLAEIINTKLSFEQISF